MFARMAARFASIPRPIRLVLKTGRVVTLTVAVGATGYQLGAAAHIRDPILMDQTTLLEFLHMEALKLHMSKDSSYGLEEGDYLVSRPYLQLKERSTLPAADLQATVHLTHIDDGKGDSFSNDAVENVLSPSRYLKINDPDLSDDARQAHRVTVRILDAARRVVTKGLKQALTMERLKAQNLSAELDRLESEILEDPIQKHLAMLDFDAETWDKARRTLAYEWELVLVKSSLVNAFVTPLQGRRIFVYSGLVDATKHSDDEMAQVIGHEISHVLAGHSEETLIRQAFTRLLQLVALSLLDPTGGLSLMGEAALWVGDTAGLLDAQHSQTHETEADNLGLLIMAEACYNPLDGAKFFNTLAVLEKSAGAGADSLADVDNVASKMHSKKKSFSDYFNTHPRAADRFPQLEEAAHALSYIHGSEQCRQYVKAKSAAKRKGWW